MGIAIYFADEIDEFVKSYVVYYNIVQYNTIIGEKMSEQSTGIIHKVSDELAGTRTGVIGFEFESEMLGTLELWIRIVEKQEGEDDIRYIKEYTISTIYPVNLKTENLFQGDFSPQQSIEEVLRFLQGKIEDVEVGTFRQLAPDNAKDAYDLYEKIYDLYARLTIQPDNNEGNDIYLELLADGIGVISREVRSIREKMFMPAPLGLFFNSAVNDLNKLYSILEKLGGDFDNRRTRSSIHDYREIMYDMARTLWSRGYMEL